MGRRTGSRRRLVYSNSDSYIRLKPAVLYAGHTFHVPYMYDIIYVCMYVLFMYNIYIYMPRACVCGWGGGGIHMYLKPPRNPQILDSCTSNLLILAGSCNIIVLFKIPFQLDKIN